MIRKVMLENTFTVGAERLFSIKCNGCIVVLNSPVNVKRIKAGCESGQVGDVGVLAPRSHYKP